MANTSNIDRTLSVLKNFTAEFTKPEYGSVVTGISVLNEPRLTGNFTMPTLKRFYTQAAQIVRDAAQHNVEVVIHGASTRAPARPRCRPFLLFVIADATPLFPPPDAFWGPNYWSDYDPLSNTSASSPDWLTLDTHQYFAFAPFENLPRQDILQHICNTSRLLKSTTSGIPGTIVGEWSLETGESRVSFCVLHPCRLS